jgi:hypothetical protein
VETKWLEHVRGGLESERHEYDKGGKRDLAKEMLLEAKMMHMHAICISVGMTIIMLADDVQVVVPRLLPFPPGCRVMVCDRRSIYGNIDIVCHRWSTRILPSSAGYRIDC